MNKLDSIISQIRDGISEVAEGYCSETKDLVHFLGVNDESEYHSVMDSLILLEDTQLAKDEFIKVDLINEPIGKLYLVFYGVLNSCYMQQQAILVMSNKLNIDQYKSEIKDVDVVAYRNDFSAHSPNRGRGKSEYSFMLDRFAMREAKVKGYTANHQTGDVFREANIYDLISEWDLILERQLVLVADKLLKV
ncbi:hypothetical protein [Vibrio crassostreae]|uniref:hypothetical protein n=1 Tax=Vibrio crassostreae TaxID=246167 RepID=UPI00104366CA|nr:hypothetical protein [Vibrio crassostreae]TCV20616.1 hypothetical protein EDB11_115102 [Vibrio crassostreae]